MIVSDPITAVLQIGQFRHVRSVGVLIVGCGYLFDAVIIAMHALSFPEVFSVTGLFGPNRQTTPWLWAVWHGVFPVFICAYALVVGTKWNATVAEHRTGPATLIGIAAALGIAAACALLTTWGIDLLPEVIRGNDYNQIVTSGIEPAAWSISLIALVLLSVRTRGRSVLDLWLMVVMVAWLLDIFLSTLVSTVRYDFGWYAGRAYGLVAASFVLGALLFETNLLYGRLARAFAEATEKNSALETRSDELARSHSALQEKNSELQAALKELDAFSYTVSHDLRAPLRSIDGFSRILLDHHASELTPESREHLQTVRDNAVQMGHLIDDLLAFSRLQRKQLSKQPVPTKAIVEQVLREVQSQAGERRVNVSVGDLPTLWGDPALLKQVFMNLIDNAFKYTRMRAEAIIENGAREIGGPMAAVSAATAA